MKKISVIGATLLATAVLRAAPISLHQSQDRGLSLSVDKAQARIGRPLTPGSVAGIHRRHQRRAYHRGSYYGGGYYPYSYHGPAISTMAAITIIGATLITAIAIGSHQQTSYQRGARSAAHAAAFSPSAASSYASSPARKTRPPTATRFPIRQCNHACRLLSLGATTPA